MYNPRHTYRTKRPNAALIPFYVVLGILTYIAALYPMAMSFLSPTMAAPYTMLALAVLALGFTCHYVASVRHTHYVTYPWLYRTR